MNYQINEMFYSLQGEGANAGRAAVFCRFSGCNLWAGTEEERGSAVCQFCDTSFLGVEGSGGGVFKDAKSLACAALKMWPACSLNGIKPFVICTGGEPLLQLDSRLIDAFHEKGFQVAIETNGTIEAPDNIDWICVSPKAGAELVQKEGNELKLVFPQEGADPQQYGSLKFERFYLQPMDGSTLKENTQKAVQYCLNNPQWRLSLQGHKAVNIR
jgi:7-carboxy-7-deazaguanine synthase